MYTQAGPSRTRTADEAGLAEGAAMGEGVFGSYQVEGRVGVGATSTVWKARQPDTDRDVAIKELDPALVTDAGFLEHFRVEARLLASFDHPNIVRVYDFVEEPDAAWIVEEWVNGAGLDAVAAQGRLSPEQALGVLRGALRGLAHAHESGIVHGDVKPANILVDVDGTSKLVDFGLATPVDTPTQDDDETAWSGTLGYIAPELTTGQTASPAADVYAAGVVLHELLTGDRLFTADSPAAVLAAQREAEIPPVPDVGDRLNDLLRQAISVGPAQRPPNAAALLAELEERAAERYGAAWLSAGSIATLAGLAATTTGAVGLITASAGTAATGSTGSAGATLTTAQTAHAGTRVAGKVAGKAGRSVAKKWVFAGIGATTVAAVTVGVALALRSDPELELSGSWNLEYTFTDAQSIGPRVGETVTRDVTMTRTCDGGTCTTSMEVPATPGTKSLPLTKEGDAYSATNVTTQNCIADDGTVLIKDAGTVTEQYSFAVTKSSKGRADELRGNWTADFAPTEELVVRIERGEVNCSLRPDVQAEATIVGARK